MLSQDIWVIVFSVGLSALTSFSIAKWKTNTLRKHQRRDTKEEWYRQTISLCSLINWELTRIDDDVSIADHQGRTSFSELQVNEDSEKHELHFVDELVYELFKHAGNAPYELRGLDPSNSANSATDEIYDFVVGYLQAETDATIIDPTVGNVRKDWNNNLKNIQDRCESGLKDIQTGFFIKCKNFLFD